MQGRGVVSEGLDGLHAVSVLRLPVWPLPLWVYRS